jgi:hypothetical protein
MDKGKRRGTSELVKLFDTHATWVVRAKSGVIGNAPSLRAALELAARKSDSGSVESIMSATRFENERVHIPSRQVRRLIELSNGTPRQSNPNSAPKRRLPFSVFAWTFSRRKSGKESNSSRGDEAASMNLS